MKDFMLFLSLLLIASAALSLGQSGIKYEDSRPHQSVNSRQLYESEPFVRVRVMNSAGTVKIIFFDEWILSSGETRKRFSADSNEVIFQIQNGSIAAKDKHGEAILSGTSFVLTGKNPGASLKVKDVPYGVGWWWEGKEDKIYGGELSFYVNKEEIFEVVIGLPLEEYLKGVVPYEIGGDSPLEAIKAQAVAARSEALTALKSKVYSGEYYDLTSDVECQVYGGNERRTEISDRAVIETSGQVVFENQSPISAYYASNCGGHSELIKNVWPDRYVWDSYAVSGFDWNEPSSIDLSNDEKVRDWILSSPQSYCNPETNAGLPQWSKNNFRWKREFTVDEISTMASGGKEKGNLLDIRSLNRGTSGRITKAEFLFEKDTLLVEGELKIRQMFTPPLRSSAFIVDRSEIGFLIQGAGWGHGVGMCQSGAVAMANLGKTFDAILKHYYKKSELVKMY
ncbi:MAG: SpoIID/LytB domain-containing protein [Ignavibacteriaceae bacterium]|nr:SpoIID/LytB domain-containing protein [Ignavibacteriaceae bacterium]